MTISSFSKMVIVWNNIVNATDVTSVVTTGITGFVSGFDKDNLKYPDPWTMMKTNGVTAAPTIEFNWGASVGPTVVGIANHNLRKDQSSEVFKYDNIDIEHWNGASYDVVGNVNITTNKDIVVVFSAGTPQTKWRLTINEFIASTFPDFSIGSIYWCTSKKELLTNPSNIVRTTRLPVSTEESAGGAKHVTFGAPKRTSVMELEFTRGNTGDVTTWQSLDENETIGIIGPDMVDGIDNPIGDTVLWGYVTDVNTSPKGPGRSQSAPFSTYNYTVFLEGAV